MYKKRREEADKDGSKLTKLEFEECVVLILDLLRTNPATIIIDALDECDPAKRNRNKLLRALDDIIEKSANIVKVFVSSRDDQDIASWWARSRDLYDYADLYVSKEDSSKDIERFVRSQVVTAIKQEALLRGNVSDDLKDRIIKILIQKAEGMYVFGACCQLFLVANMFPGFG